MTSQSNNGRSPRYRVYICDDEEEMIRRFRRKHDVDLDIKAFTTIKELQDAANEQEPDLILLDLFWGRDDVDPELTKAADAKLYDFQRQIPAVRDAIYQAYSPTGIEGLKYLRKELPTTPIMIHSKTGQLLLSEQDITNAVDLEVGWLPKNQENVMPNTEILAIRQFIKSKKRTNDRINHSPQPSSFDWKWAAISGLLLVIALLLLPHALAVGGEAWTKIASTGTVLVAFLTSVVSLGREVLRALGARAVKSS
jgi:CheY-like chemotaxis protein